MVPKFLGNFDLAWFFVFFFFAARTLSKRLERWLQKKKSSEHHKSTNCGFLQGFVVPTINALVTPWFPAIERSTAVAIYTSGIQLGGLFGSSLAAFLCASSWKWPSVFYVSGMFIFKDNIYFLNLAFKSVL